MDAVPSTGRPAGDGRALARIGLLGNPSDGYGGAVLATTIRDFAVRVHVESADEFVFADASVSSWRDCDAASLDGATPLLVAALRCFVGLVEDRFPRVEVRPMRFEVASDVPFRVGLSGSSAIVIAALRALDACTGVGLTGDELARLALAAETEELSITAGPQDRVIQAHEGVLLMDFRDEWTLEPLDVDLLPALFLAWQTEGGQDSGKAHDTVRPRYLARDPEVVAAMDRFRVIAHDGCRAIREHDMQRLGELMNENFDLRAALFPIADRDHELVAIARAHGSAAKFCGSGGGVVGVLDGNTAELEALYREAGFSFLVPTPGRSNE